MFARYRCLSYSRGSLHPVTSAEGTSAAAPQMKLLLSSRQRCSARTSAVGIWWLSITRGFSCACITEAEQTERCRLLLRSSGYNQILCLCSVVSPERTVRAGAGWSRPRCSHTRPASPAPIGLSDGTVREAVRVSSALTPTPRNPGKVSHFKLSNTLRARVPRSACANTRQSLSLLGGPARLLRRLLHISPCHPNLS